MVSQPLVASNLFVLVIMSISNLSLVNQKLAYATILLADMESEGSIGAYKLRQSALAEATVHHLSIAFHFYLREIADQYRVKSTSAIDSITDLANMLDSKGFNPSEVTELTRLKEEAGSWLNLLLAQKRLLFQSPERQKEKKAFPANKEAMLELVNAIEISEPEPLLLSHQLLSEWLACFREMLERHRDTYAEY